VKRIRDEKKKRIVASIETVGASGAYYVHRRPIRSMPTRAASWIDRRDCRVGQLRRTAEVAKLNAITMKAGEFKDTGSPTREMTPAEREYMQA